MVFHQSFFSLQYVTAQRAAAKFWCSSLAARSKSCQRATSSRTPSGATSEGRTKRSIGARWRAETLSTRWSSSWRRWLPVLRCWLCLLTPPTHKITVYLKRTIFLHRLSSSHLKESTALSFLLFFNQLMDRRKVCPHKCPLPVAYSVRCGLCVYTSNSLIQNKKQSVYIYLSFFLRIQLLCTFRQVGNLKFLCRHEGGESSLRKKSQNHLHCEPDIFSLGNKRKTIIFFCFYIHSLFLRSFLSSFSGPWSADLCHCSFMALCGFSKLQLLLDCFGHNFIYITFWFAEPVSSRPQLKLSPACSTQKRNSFFVIMK